MSQKNVRAIIVHDAYVCVCVVRVNGVWDVGGEEVLVQLSHATQERMRDIVEKLTEISQHRMQVLKVCSSDVMRVFPHPFLFMY